MPPRPQFHPQSQDAQRFFLLDYQVFYCQLLLQALQTEVTGCSLGNLGTGAREGSRREQCAMAHPLCVIGEGI